MTTDNGKRRGPAVPGPIEIDDDVDLLPTGALRCSAKAKSTQSRCKSPAISGGTVCRTHGGSAPQVQKAASRRLSDLVPLALEVLRDLAMSEDEKVAAKAVESILDRTGHVRGQEVTVEDARDRLRERLTALREQKPNDNVRHLPTTDSDDSEDAA